MEILGLITARGGSKSIPGKNVKLLAGKPLIRWTIDEAMKSSLVSRLVVSTDDDEIERVSLEGGAEVPFRRPAEMAGDASPHIEVIIHALEWLKFEQDYEPDYVLLLQPTSPFRTVIDIDGAIQLAALRPESEAIVGVSETEHHPFLAKKIEGEGVLEDFVKTDIPYLRRQDLPPAYVINGAIYLNKTESLRKIRKLIPSGTLAYVMPQDRSLDVDTPWDFYLADLIMRDRMRHEIH